MKRLLTVVVVVLATLVLMAASLVWVTRLVVDWNPKTRRQPATSPPHEMFPILVLTPDNEPHLVYQKDLRQFVQEHPEATFLVPEGAEKELNQKLDARSRYHRKDFDWQSNDPLVASFKVRRLGPAHQELEVEGTWDDDRQNVGWYEVRGRQIVPRYHQLYFGPGVAMASCLPAVAITGAFWAIVLGSVAFAISRKRLRSRGQTIPPLRP